jgi:hypothetical protein
MARIWHLKQEGSNCKTFHPRSVREGVICYVQCCELPPVLGISGIQRHSIDVPKSNPNWLCLAPNM